MTVINSNSAAMLTANSINKNERMMTSTMERLSTGKRINSAADDAAGLAIATKMTAQVRGLDQAGRNANNATSMIQLADGAAEQISNILQRMREIVVQAADGSNSASDVAVLNVEFTEAAEEVDRIVDSTEFNGKKLLNGDAGGTAGSGDSSVTFQIGANANQTLSADFGDFNLAAGGAGVYETHSIATGNLTTSTGTVLAFGDGQGNSVSLDSASYADAAAMVTAFKAADGYGDLAYTVAADSDGLTWTAKEFGDQANVTWTGSGSTIVNVAGSNVGPMGADISGYKTTGIGTDFDATLNALDTAIEGVATQRATFGATMNRLEYAVDNLASASLATATARGRIEDANYASETTALARTQIIS
ncbi:MAG: flagellin, partial [Porticoccaceae bacterium]|nr:flagellin [Porticoccaceae bacterium]